MLAVGNDVLYEGISTTVYSRNAFCVLEMDVDQPGKRLLKKEKDLLAALEHESLEEEYSTYLGPHTLPSRDEISTAGHELADAQLRFKHEFFWYWPIEWGRSSTDEGLSLLKAGNIHEAQIFWQAIAASDGVGAATAQHNLAILGHSTALERERDLLSTSNVKLKASTEKELRALWKFSFRHWQPLCHDDSFWSLVSERIRKLDDPRLSTGFIKRFTEQLPVILDNIHADLALAYCFQQSFVRAKDHLQRIRYASPAGKPGQPSLRRIIRPLEQRIEVAVASATCALTKNPAEGRQRFEELFLSVYKELNSLSNLLGSSSREFCDTCDHVAESMLQCQWAYAEGTQQWKKAIKLLDTTLKVARGTKMRDRVENVRRNMQAEICWFCNRAPRTANSNLTVLLNKPLYWPEVKQNPAEYESIITELAHQFFQSLNGQNIHQLNAEATRFFASLLEELQKRNFRALVALLDRYMDSHKAIGMRQMTIIVPRCTKCGGIHGQHSDTREVIEEKLNQAQSQSTECNQKIRAINVERTRQEQHLKQAGWFGRWRINRKLRSLLTQYSQTQSKLARTRQEIVELQSKRARKLREPTTKPVSHSNTWPAIQDAVKDGYRTV